MTKQQKWSRRDLQFELGRRRMFPADSDRMGWTVSQAASLDLLRDELARMGPDDANRSWREFELALAEEHYQLQPNVPFRRSVDVEKVGAA